jgi:hypothetical protein
MISKKAIHLAGLVLIIGLTIIGCGGRSELSDEDKVRNTLKALELGAEERSLSSILEYLSPSYLDHQGNDLVSIKGLIQLHLIRNQRINIFSNIREIEVIEDVATVEMSVAIASRGIDLSSEANRLSTDTHRFSILLRREQQFWKIQSVSWQRGW